MDVSSKTSPPRQRVLDAAFDLFYRQGYRATGINQVIAASGVAKASFYDHFPSKDDLLCEYLRELSRQEMDMTREQVRAMTTARERFFAPLRMLIPWFESSDYRGCPFQNILAEAPPDDPRVQDIAREHHEAVRKMLGELTRDLINAEPKLKRLNPDDVANTYLLLVEGAIPLAVAYRKSWPVDHAIRALEAYLTRRN